MPVRRASGAPDVSVVVIVFNDALRLPDAVASVLDQTLSNLEVVIVDDASTDGTAAVAQQLAASDDRVRVVRLEENSGGCSRPRNVGIDHARAPYVMFLDSDDTYERHACKNLLLEAERTGADVVGGLCVRENLTSGRTTPWFPWLYRERATYADIREKPDLFFDAISTNKLYRRGFLLDCGIRFPEGLHYEDQLFTAEVYCQAQVVAVIPSLVYRWNVVQREDAFSISQRRFEFNNFRDRIAVHRLIDAYLLGHGGDDLKVHKDFKFVRHDLRLYLNDLPHRDEGYQRAFMELAADYLRTVRPETLARLEPVERICVDLIRRGDVTETLKTVDWLKHGFKLSTDLVERDGRIYWSGKYLETAADRAVFDVTEMGLHRLPFGQQSVHNELTGLEVRGSTLSLRGRLTNQLGQIGTDDTVRLAVSVKNRGRPNRHFTEVADVRHEGSRIAYSVDVDLARAVTPLDLPNLVWDISLRITWGDQVNMAPFSVDPAQVEDLRVAVRGRFGGLVRGELQPYVTINGNLAMEQVLDESVPRRAVGETQRFALRAAGGVRRRARDSRWLRRTKQRAYRVFRRLPVVPGLTVFESHMGRQYSDSPKYIYQAARAAGLDPTQFSPVWVHAKSPRGFPADADHVRRGSWRYYYLLARAQYWVDNQGFPRELSKRPDTFYLQTWHGTPLKKMGFDSPALEQASEAERAAHRAMIERWDALLVPSEYFVDTFVRSYRYDGKLLRTGLPRNDLLVQGVDEQWRAAKRSELGIPDDRRVVLYAPTFRDRDRRLKKPFGLRLDLPAMQESLGGSFHLLVRTHYLDKLKLSRRYASFVTDVSRHHDVTELMLLADVLVTDYSSVMFDFANTGRPMIFYTYDYDDYVRDERGTYLELAEIAPGPMVADTEGLIAALQRLDEAGDACGERYAAFQARFCTYESGHAAEAVVRELFQGGRR